MNCLIVPNPFAITGLWITEPVPLIPETIPDDDLPNYSSEGTVTLSTGQKESVLPLELANWYGYFSPTNNFRYKYFQLQAANEAIEIQARCDNDEDTPDSIEGNAKVNGELIGSAMF